MRVLASSPRGCGAGRRGPSLSLSRSPSRVPARHWPAWPAGVAVDLRGEVGLGPSAFLAEVLDLLAARYGHLLSVPRPLKLSCAPSMRHQLFGGCAAGRAPRGWQGVLSSSLIRDLRISWLGEVWDHLAPTDVRVARPVLSRDGHSAVEGWAATELVAGAEPDLSEPSTWLALIETARALHQLVSHLPRPDFIAARADPWAGADHAAWGERPMHFVLELAELAVRLRSQPDPPGQPRLVHGDLTGNVLFAPGLPPAVIDVSPYWRPSPTPKV